MKKLALGLICLLSIFLYEETGTAFQMAMGRYDTVVMTVRCHESFEIADAKFLVLKMEVPVECDTLLGCCPGRDWSMCLDPDENIRGCISNDLGGECCWMQDWTKDGAPIKKACEDLLRLEKLRRRIVVLW